MSVPFPLSDQFAPFLMQMQTDIENLRSQLEDARADVARLTDRAGGAADAFALSTFMLPGQVVSGGRFGVSVKFQNSFNPSNWGFDFAGTPLSFLEEIDSQEVYTVGNMLNGFGEGQAIPNIIFHGLIKNQPQGNIIESEMTPSCVPIYFFPGLRDADPWNGVEPGQTDPTIRKIAGVPAMSYFKPDVGVDCN